jgi:phosphinothricin acetyltransferase
MLSRVSGRVRIARLDDAGAIAAIYAPIVEHTVISFELEPPSAEEMARRMRATLETHPWLVSEAGGEIEGYAYGSVFRARAAYRWSVETTVYVRDDCRRRGVARRLYGSLLATLGAQGFVGAFGGVTLPNAASVGLHESLGYRAVGVFPAAGWKFGAWHDVGFWHRTIGERPAHPAPPRSFAEVADSQPIQRAIESGAC